MSLPFLFLLLAFISFVLAAINAPRFNFVAIGLAFWVLALLIPAFHS